MSVRFIARRLSQLRYTRHALFSNNILPVCQQQRLLTTSSCRMCAEEGEKTKKVGKTNPEFDGKKGQQVREVDVHTSIKYLHSNAYRIAYGEDPVWKHYRRNVKGHFMPPPRETCIRSGIISSGSACPICRDDFLVFEYRNIELLKQFVNPVNFEPLNPKVTGLCKKQFKELQYAVAKAQDFGLLPKYVGIRRYNYDHYADRLDSSDTQTSDNIAGNQSSKQPS